MFVRCWSILQSARELGLLCSSMGGKISIWPWEIGVTLCPLDVTLVRDVRPLEAASFDLWTFHTIVALKFPMAEMLFLA